jgi:signal peptidase
MKLHQHTGFKGGVVRHDWYSITAFVVLLIVSLVGIEMWRMQNVGVMSVESGSMSPAIHKGDAIVVQPVNPRTLVSGDVISYRSPADQSVIITHRIIKVEPNWRLLVTQGDNAPRADKPVSMDNVIGKVNARVAYAGYALDFLRTPLGLAICVYVPAAIVVGLELKRLSAHYTRPTYRLTGYRHSH